MNAGWLALALLPLLAAAQSPPRSSDAVCAGCHKEQASHFRGTPMAQALDRVETCEILQRHPALQFQEGVYHSEIARQGDRSILTVTQGTDKFTVPLLWAFGLGRAGQTYVFQTAGAFYESRVSYFDALGGLDLTMGAANGKPGDILEAAGRRMDAIDQRQCFGCHSNGGVSGGKLHLETMIAGVGCRSCHAGADEHVTAVRSGKAAAKMQHLAELSAEDSGELCGRCHRTWSQIALSGPRGVNNVRFQPYRLANSKCYDAADRRLRCSACHDPHGALETNLAAYDSKCAACHSAALHAKVCSVAKVNCAGCHMPKVELPGAHARFTDHQIRIARAGEPYPN